MSLERATLAAVALGKLGELADSGKLTIDSDVAKFKDLLGMFDRFDFWFTIAEP